MTLPAFAVIAISIVAVGIRAQEKPPAFEVASVKPSNPNPSGPLGMFPMVMPAPNGRLTATNVPLRVLVRMAYGVQDFQIDGGPSWQLSQRFDITAKADDDSPATMTAMLPMLKTLLAERFKLKVHTETREMPVSSLVIAREDGKLGPNLKPTTSDCSNAEAENQIAQLLTQATGRIVTDKTGLYDWEIGFDPQIMMQIASQVGVNLPAGVTPPQSDSPSLLTALREDLGVGTSVRLGVGSWDKQQFGSWSCLEVGSWLLGSWELPKKRGSSSPLLPPTDQVSTVARWPTFHCRTTQRGCVGYWRSAPKSPRRSPT